MTLIVSRKPPELREPNVRPGFGLLLDPGYGEERMRTIISETPPVPGQQS
jgi:hypothetical protein